MAITASTPKMEAPERAPAPSNVEMDWAEGEVEPGVSEGDPGV